MAAIPRWFPALASGMVAIMGGIAAFTAAAGLTRSSPTQVGG
jgi:hypothetical protein